MTLFQWVRPALAAAALLGLAGCQTVGPTAITDGREHYNSIIQQTSMEQTLANIVRVYHHEPTMFMDVTEVDATESASGSLGPAVTGIGAHRGASGGTLAGQVESVTGSVQYSETPTIRYLPLVGQPLVTQLASPVSVDALAALYDSHWPVTPLLGLSTAYLTPALDQTYSALAAITELDNDDAIDLVAGKSDLSKADAAPKPTVDFHAPGPDKTNISLVTNPPPGSPGAGTEDTLFVYFVPFKTASGSTENAVMQQRDLQLWVHLVQIYKGTQPVFTPAHPKKCPENPLSDDALASLEKKTAEYKADVKAVIPCLPDSIELRTSRVSEETVRAKFLDTGSPVMRTMSALGILKDAVERPHPKIEFVPPETYRAIRNRSTHSMNQDPSAAYYTLLPSDEDKFECSDSEGCDNPPATTDAAYLATRSTVEDWLKWCQQGNLTTIQLHDCSKDAVSYERSGKALSYPDTWSNIRLWNLRRYVLVIVDKTLPTNAYVSYRAPDGNWYYIDGKDDVSQRNFHLLSLFLTMMAAPPAAPLSPSINVGG